MTRRYILITPCRNESEHLAATIESVARQSVPPARWIIVDDGSNDETPRILAEAAARLPFIEVVRRDDRGRRSVGPGVIEAFETGLERVALDRYDYLCKLDADLEIPATYFERVMERFEADPWLGTFSGKLWMRVGDVLVEERCGDENSVGPAKFYRVGCFRDIGGFARRVGWDGIDGHLCRLRGWSARSADGDDLELVHRRRMGSSENSFWTGRLRWGGGKYAMGSSLPYMLAVSVYRAFERPWLVSGAGILAGYLLAWWRDDARLDDAECVAALRRFEHRALVVGKRRALAEEEARLRRAFDRAPRVEQGFAAAA